MTWSWPLLWVLLGVLALAGEAASMALFLLNVGLAAFVAAVLAALAVPVIGQAAVFVVVSVLLIGLARPRMLQALVGRSPRLALTTQDALVGRLATVTEPVTEDGGAIRVGKAEFWTARSGAPAPPIAAGSRVRIARIDGLTAYVEPVAEAVATAEPAPSGGTAEPAPAPAFGELLRRYRGAANLTQEELAQRAGLSVRAISDLERGLHRSPQRETVQLLAEALQVTDEQRAAFEAAARRLHAASSQAGRQES